MKLNKYIVTNNIRDKIKESIYSSSIRSPRQILIEEVNIECFKFVEVNIDKVCLEVDNMWISIISGLKMDLYDFM